MRRTSVGYGLAALAAAGGAAWLMRSRTGGLSALINQTSEAVDKSVGWHKLPLPLAVPVLIGLRNTLREQNLYDTRTLPSTGQSVPVPEDQRYRTVRTADGSFNDLSDPLMGATGTRMGRNVPLEYASAEQEPDLMTPNPRTVSLELMTREQFQPATTLNVLAAAWLQFMVRDWFSHGKSPRDNPWRIPLADNDPWPERPMTIVRTPPDPTRPASDAGMPDTRVNAETHWWDASQIYGSTKPAQMQVRSGEGGKMKMGPDGLPAIDPSFERHPADVSGFWLGLGLLYTLFTLEHNAICDRLHAEYPSWSDDDLFDHARMINAALMAKIHTIEWTPGIISHPTTTFAMNANWWGLQGERLHRLFGRLSRGEVLSGIPGSEPDHHTAPFAMTEEFVAVYRMHPLVPDDYDFRSATNGAPIRQAEFPELVGKYALGLLHQISLTDLMYSFGIAHPGAITLHNFPRHLQHFNRPDGILQDMAATDILRSRELGVPRYTKFRELMHMRPIRTFEELTDNPQWVEELRRVYENDIDKVDLTVGMFAEPKPQGFGFSDTAFRVFILMASRRLKSDRFYTSDFTPEVYTPVGMDWINNNTMSTVLLRHFPGLAPALHGVPNAFGPWNKLAD